MGKYLIIGLLYCAGITPGYPQSTDIMKAEYTMIPRGDSEIEVSRLRFVLNIPTRVGTDNYLVTGAEYNQIDFDSTREFPFEDEDIKKLFIIDLNLGYIFKWNPQWRFVGIVSPRIASNFIRGVEKRDFRINLTGTFWKEVQNAEKPFRIVLGLTYNSTTGLPFPLPLISYYRRFHPNWSFAAGIPKSNFKYHISERHTLQTELFLDGYFVNIQNDILLPDDSIGSSISLSALVIAQGYQFNFTKKTSVYGMAGYALTQKGLLRDDKRTNVYELNKEGNLYFRTGIKISIL